MIAVVIVAAGRGTRMGSDADKLFLPVAGRPLVGHTWALFDGLEDVAEIIVVVRSGEEDRFRLLAVESGFQKTWRCVTGGGERQDSVWNGLRSVSSGIDWVAIQDGARPCTSPRAVRAILEAARRVGAAVAAQKVQDTLKEADDERRAVRTVDRERLWSVQTPQVFRVEVIRRAMEAVRARGLRVTDDTAACELIAQPVELVETVDPNPKVTVPSDLEYVGWLLGRRRDGPGG